MWSYNAVEMFKRQCYDEIGAAQKSKYNEDNKCYKKRDGIGCYPAFFNISHNIFEILFGLNPLLRLSQDNNW